MFFTVSSMWRFLISRNFSSWKSNHQNQTNGKTLIRSIWNTKLSYEHVDDEKVLFQNDNMDQYYNIGTWYLARNTSSFYAR